MEFGPTDAMQEGTAAKLPDGSYNVNIGGNTFNIKIVDGKAKVTVVCAVNEYGQAAEQATAMAAGIEDGLNNDPAALAEFLKDPASFAYHANEFFFANGGNISDFQRFMFDVTTGWVTAHKMVSSKDPRDRKTIRDLGPALKNYNASNGTDYDVFAFLMMQGYAVADENSHQVWRNGRWTRVLDQEFIVTGQKGTDSKASFFDLVRTHCSMWIFTSCNGTFNGRKVSYMKTAIDWLWNIISLWVPGLPSIPVPGSDGYDVTKETIDLICNALGIKDSNPKMRNSVGLSNDMIEKLELSGHDVSGINSGDLFGQICGAASYMNLLLDVIGNGRNTTIGNLASATSRYLNNTFGGGFANSKICEFASGVINNSTGFKFSENVILQWDKYKNGVNMDPEADDDNKINDSPYAGTLIGPARP